MPDALIHLRLAAARKGCWVRVSRADGLRLTDWIINIVESHMAKKSYIQQSADEGLIDHATALGLELALTGRGGPGRGQGIKAADGATGLKRRNITIDDASADVLREYGNGDLSVGIRRAARAIKTE